MNGIIGFIIGTIFGMALYRIIAKHRRKDGTQKRPSQEKWDNPWDKDPNERVRLVYFDEVAEVTDEQWKEIQRWVQERDRLFVSPSKAWEAQFLGKFDPIDPEKEDPKARGRRGPE